MPVRPSDRIETLFKDNYARLCYFAARLLQNQEEPEDLVQDVFLRYWNSGVELGSEQEARSYLYASVRNACYNRIRHSQVEKKFALTASTEEPGEETWGLDHLIRSEVLGEIHRAIESLPAGCRQVLKLAYFESLKNEEIATRLQVSVNTVKTQKARAIKLLRIRLDPSAFIFFLLFLRS